RDGLPETVAAFEVEQPPFAGQAAGVPGQLAVRADHPVATDNDADRIASDRRTHFLSRRVQLTRKLAVRRRAPVRTSRSQFPNSLLERRSAQVERKVEFRTFTGKIFAQLGPDVIEAVSRFDSERLAFRPVPVMREIQTGNAGLVAHDRELTEGRFDRAVPNN